MQDHWVTYNVKFPSDDAEHTIFWCPYWVAKRTKLSKQLGRDVVPEDVERILYGPDRAQDQSSWGVAHEGIQREFLDMVEVDRKDKEVEKRTSQRLVMSQESMQEA